MIVYFMCCFECFIFGDIQIMQDLFNEFDDILTFLTLLFFFLQGIKILYPGFSNLTGFLGSQS